MRNFLKTGVGAAFLGLVLWACQSRPDPNITADELKAHDYYLASEELKGRFPGTEGDSLAEKYITDQFHKYHLKSWSGPGTESFEVTLGVTIGDSGSLTVNGMKADSGDFVPLAYSETGKVSGELLFAGYGFQINRKDLHWDDYNGLDVKGKIVLILMGAPDWNDTSKPDPFEVPGATRTKLLLARDAGAAGVILIAGEKYDPSDQLKFENRREQSAGLPVIRVKRSFIESALSSKSFSVNTLQDQLNRDQQPVKVDIAVEVTMNIDLHLEQAMTRDVAAWIPAADTGARQEWIIIGAHFDHLGQGGPGSPSRVPDTIATHFGADDNASGVSGVLELAGLIASHKDELKRSVLFICFTGEEMGLLGSKYFVDHTSIPLDRITAMINLDMIGRPNEENRLAVGGVGTAVEFDTLIKEPPSGCCHIVKSPEGYGPSDHASFYQKGIPVLFYSTGAHQDYHTPRDTPDKLNYPWMEKALNEIGKTIRILADQRIKLTFKEAGPRTSTSGRRNLKVTFGIMPDVTGEGNNGLRVEFVTPGKPADRSGMKKGDRIIQINGKPVMNIYDYMTRLQQLHLGQTVTVEVVRNGKNEVLLVQL